MPPKLPPKKYKEEEKEEKGKKKKIKSNKVDVKSNQYCSNCPHRPQQSLTPKDSRKLQKQSNYSKLYKIT